MLASGIPSKFNIPFASSAGAGFIRTIPQASQIGIQNGAASLTDGFPPLCFLSAGAGGVSPFGEDFNGVLKQITQWNQWQSAGGPVPYDSAFQAAIGGYPLGAIVSSVTTAGLWWYSQVDSNVSNPDTGGANWLGFNLTQTVPAMQGRFQLSTGTACTLTPTNGGLLWINGLNYQIPSAGVNFSSGSLSGNTLYYAYTRIAGGVMTGDLSPTGYALSSGGIPQKIGDATRTLVGMVYTTGGGGFVSQDGSLQVLSWGQRQFKRSRTQFSADRSVSSAAFVEINTEIRNSFLVWANENLNFMTNGSFGVAASNREAATQVSFDGAAGEQETVICFGTTVGGSGGLTVSCPISGVKTGLSEGLHFATLLGATTSGTATWNSSNTNASSTTTLIIALQG